MNTTYLCFELGNSDEARGRLFLHIQDNEGDKPLQRLVDIHSTALKEALREEVLKGRLIATEIFEPSYVKVHTPKEPIRQDQIRSFAEEEHRDLVVVHTKHLEQQLLSEAVLEQVIARYTTICRDNIYVRLLQQLADEIFRDKKKTFSGAYYISLFRMASDICMILKKRREEDLVDVEFYRDSLLLRQRDLPFLDLKRIGEVVSSGNTKQWREITEYIDAFYLSLKMYFPYFLHDDVCFFVSEDARSWLEEGLADLYNHFFFALFKENYERAMIIQEEIDSYYTLHSSNNITNHS